MHDCKSKSKGFLAFKFTIKESKKAIKSFLSDTTCGIVGLLNITERGDEHAE